MVLLRSHQHQATNAHCAHQGPERVGALIPRQGRPGPWVQYPRGQLQRYPPGLFSQSWLW